ncbi:hypothetical protein CFC21_052928 [Triticum aestivum]|uniref:Dynamin-type G domain-containing protein n=2 Tax=Triticum aestivum TaxID=4565 RepID=A0A3B6HYW6_WHEAT|nr:hypothetical protein CFC21_052928 [Triticum aestivum]
MAKPKAKRLKSSPNDAAAADGVAASAIASSYNDHIRPLLDAVDRLRHLNVTQEGIQLPTIVVVGDQSSGKSSVLESLAGISLPRGQGICTRAPLVMRLKGDPSGGDAPVLQLEYGAGRVVSTSEAEIAGSGKGISDRPITLFVRKRGLPDLTLVDLPGITRVPVKGQPDDIYEQVAGIIQEYIAPKESIILNVLSATVDFPTCESIRMSQQVDRNGDRTLAVVTKQVTMDDVNIGLGYVCVRNRVGDETHDQARAEEERLFDHHPLLSRIDKSMVGIAVLVQRLMQIQATIIAKCLPDIVSSTAELEQMPPDLNNVADAVRAFFHIVKRTCSSVEKMLVRGEFEECPDDRHFHGTARIAEMLNAYAKKLPAECPEHGSYLFLMEEVRILEETTAIKLPDFLPRSAFLVLLKKKVQTVVQGPHDLVREVWDYVEDLTLKVLLQHSTDFPQVQPSCRRAVQSMMDKARAQSARHVTELIDMELVADYTYNPDYSKLMEGYGKFMEAVKDRTKPTAVTLKGFGKVERLAENDLEVALSDELLGNKMTGVERMLAPSPGTGSKRQRLKKSIVLLQQSKEAVAYIMGKKLYETRSHG